MVRHAALLLAFILPALAATAEAQQRSIPDTAKRAYVRSAQVPLVNVDGRDARLAPGATVRDQRNLIIVPAALPREGAWADYVLDGNGQIIRIWLLTPEELAAPKPASQK